eukprot:CAMPEP_0206364418 /NCGR_PEP_ID=MMETSP0294-20121207/2206_1 /ASSEMBLY_ACC=CAM_ASM_000327 /TAXON_ID=39354 /ORGANISM="Heterosigma akashiwo, Strain CCMP2393" /LENGTH=100 /DNA_ID=CAMNT_0053810011 /DNA_START=671 /DNA_END=970 /DNA_ORIENTATION=+
MPQPRSQGCTSCENTSGICMFPKAAMPSVLAENSTVDESLDSLSAAGSSLLGEDAFTTLSLLPDDWSIFSAFSIMLASSLAAAAASAAGGAPPSSVVAPA